jgi:hypothetical protein
MMLSLQQLAFALGGKVSGGQVLAPGPNHSAGDRSMSVMPAANEKGYVVNSFGRSTWQECDDYVAEKLGIGKWQPKAKASSDYSTSFFFKAQPATMSANAAPTATVTRLHPENVEYVYLDASGNNYLKVLRYYVNGERKFKQFHWTGTAWADNAPKGPKIPYRLPELIAAPFPAALIVEGEKDVDNVVKLGYPAVTTNAGGSKSWHSDLNQYFQDRDVVIVPDNDPAGEKWADTVFENLKGVAASIKVLRLPGLPDKGDISDWIEAGGTYEQLNQLLNAAPAHEDAAKTKEEPEQPEESAEQAEPVRAKEPRFRFETMADLRAMPPQEQLIDGWIPERSVGLLYGKWGSGKTFVGFDWALHLAFGLPDWHGAKLPGVPVDVLIIAREGHAGFVKRVGAFMAHHGIEADPERLVFMRSPISFVDDASFEALKESVRALGRPFRFVLVDTVARVLPGVEMGKEAPVTAFMERLQQLGEITGGTSMGVHHENKSGDANGSMFFQNNSDFMFNIEREGSGALERGKITCVKSKEDDDNWTRGIQFEKVWLWDGRSSLVVKSVNDDAGKAGADREQTLSPDEAIFYRFLFEAEKNGKKGLSIEEWNEIARKEGFEPKRRGRFIELRNALKDKGRVREYAGIWKVSHKG